MSCDAECLSFASERNRLVASSAPFRASLPIALGICVWRRQSQAFFRGYAQPRRPWMSSSAGHERPRAEWIEIPVTPIIREETFALAAERLQSNKDHAPRRTITPSVVQGLVSCRKCGYGLYRTATRTSARM